MQAENVIGNTKSMKQILAIQNRNKRRRVIETKFSTVFQTLNRMKNYQTQRKFTVSITRLVLFTF